MTRFLAGALSLVCVSASPPGVSPADWVRSGNIAFAQGDLALAEECYQRAAETTDDPGLVAYNRGCVALAAGDYRAAELLFLQASSDAAASMPRRVQAEYNRGVALVHRTDESHALRAACTAFEHVLAMLPPGHDLDPPARQNLELAKLLWAEAVARENRSADSTPPPLTNVPAPVESPMGTAPGGTAEPGSTSGDPDPNAPPEPANATDRGQTPQQTERLQPGAGTLPVVMDRLDAPPLSSADARIHLQRAAQRIQQDRKANDRLLAGPERPHVRDW